ncbi:MAG: hypothetical protein DRJ03_01550 [Chloroflexi bacterium]|nr:MAG: hypothetical protein DRJ03_01550 [Chloroflexota bacterium]
MYKKALSVSCAIVGLLIYNLFAIAGASNLYDKSPIVAWQLMGIMIAAIALSIIIFEVEK